ncbi:cytochrome b [Lichenihabitans sp. PAMC28606]|uniref:cytochrome b n=1 Tax=Lichenihabitans sp. PAMC28606 TaxID=2880932 RepID=UPI001D0AFC0C|nr:cytochrome b [Lichenihabitans sp. PAMC28606]UDL92985.1 cytochrome b [Lichenihabitans sp. PAMC28606]
MSASVERGQRYTSVAIALHWLIGLAILAMVVMGLLMVHGSLAPADKFRLYQLHKSVGLTILILAVLRLVWRFSHRPPTLPADMPAWERGAAEGTHVVLYAFMIGLPLVGWALVSASPFNLPTVLYGVLPWPHLSFLSSLPAASKKSVGAVLEMVHAYGAYVLIAFVALHAGAALRHYFIEQDTILQRMIPGLPRFGARSTTRP